MIQGWTAWRTCRQYYGMGATFLMAAAYLVTNPALASRVESVDISADKVVLEFDGTVTGASAFLLDGPQRIAVDVSGAEAGKASSTGGAVSKVRQGQYDGDTARVVLELARPALVSGGSFSKDGRRLTIKLADARATDFSQAAKSGRISWLPPLGFRAAPPRSKYSITIPLDPPRKSAPLPRIQGPAGRPLVVIDAGHGGHDPGAISPHGGQREKDATLAIARKIRDELLASGRVRVALTREDDRFIVLNQRYEIARRLKADLFMSIHADSAASQTATGATIYTLSEVASDREAAKLAARENKADMLNGVNLGGASNEVSTILIDLTQRETMNISAQFANLLKREANQVPFRSDYHRFAALIVLKAPDVPSVLFETGYLSNVNDVKFLFSDDGRTRIARGAAKAIETHFARQLAAR